MLRHYVPASLRSERREGGREGGGGSEKKKYCDLIEGISSGFVGWGVLEGAGGSQLPLSRRNVFTVHPIPGSFVISAWNNVYIFRLHSTALSFAGRLRTRALLFCESVLRIMNKDGVSINQQPRTDPPAAVDLIFSGFFIFFFSFLSLSLPLT